jgi:hypothetical protein
MHIYLIIILIFNFYQSVTVSSVSHQSFEKLGAEILQNKFKTNKLFGEWTFDQIPTPRRQNASSKVF